MTDVKKSRNLKFHDYFITLQLEWIVAELRKKIYSSPEDKEQCQKIMDFKYSVIKDIATRNRMKTIFKEFIVDMPNGDTELHLYDEKLRNKLYMKIYNEKGLPNFIYRSDEHKQKLHKKDLYAYYRLNTEFKHDGEIGVLKRFDLINNTAMLQIGNKLIKCDLKNIVRLL